MRKLLAAFGVGLLLSASGALSVDEQIAEWRGIFSRAKIRPLRTVNGKVHNITPLADFMINLEKPTAHHTRPPGFDDWAWIVGEVIQVADDGLLIRNYGDVSLDGRYETVFLVNAPSQNTRVDGSKIGALAMLVGRQQYVTTTGAKATVQKYDCGPTPAREIIVAHEQNQRAKIEESLALRNSILARQESERTARQITATTKAVETSSGAQTKAMHPRNTISGCVT